ALSPRIVLNRQAAKGFAQHKVPAEMRIPGAIANATPRITGVIDDAGYQPTAYVRADELTTWLPPDKMVDEQRGEGMRVYLAPGSGDLGRILQSRMVALGVN